MVRRILTARGKFKRILRTPCTEVVDPAEAIEIMRDLKDTLCATVNATGLAAPQIGKSLRAFVMKDGQTVVGFLNPKVVEKSNDVNVAEEGCLSIPGFRTRVARCTKIVVEHDHGTIKADGFRARVIQHELDHLDGVLISDLETLHA